MNNNTNYIVSGLERSGTSLMMQILDAGGLSISYDNSREADENNPNGYYELYNGKINYKLLNNEIDFNQHKGKFIKITAFGLEYLPKGNYEIIFMERNIEEILDSMEKMSPTKINREELKGSLINLRNYITEDMRKREDVKLIRISYGGLVSEANSHPDEIDILKKHYPELDVEKSRNVIDRKLYRNRRSNVENK